MLLTEHYHVIPLIYSEIHFYFIDKVVSQGLAELASVREAFHQVLPVNRTA